MSSRAGAQRDQRGGEGDETLQQLLLRELPPGMAEQAPYVVNAVLTAGARNELYNAHRNEWIDYAGRKRSLRRVASLANQLASELCALDILSHTKLVSPADPRQLSALVGSLEFLKIVARVTALEIQDTGRPRDLAEEGWILEMAREKLRSRVEEVAAAGKLSSSETEARTFLEAWRKPEKTRE